MNKLGLFCIVLGVIGLISFLITILLAGYIDERIQDECDSDIGTIGQIIGADEGQCQDARDWKSLITSLQIPILSIGALLGLTGGMMIFRD